MWIVCVIVSAENYVWTVCVQLTERSVQEIFWRFLFRHRRIFNLKCVRVEESPSWCVLKASKHILIWLLKPGSAMWSGSWTDAAGRPARLTANFRLPSTDTEDVSTSVEQSLIHLSSSSSSSRAEPPAFSFPQHFFPPPAAKLPLSLCCRQKLKQHLRRRCVRLSKATNHTIGYLRWGKSEFLFWGWPWGMWVLPLAGDCGCLVWA